MIKPKVLEGFNEQINKEIFSSYLYLSMSAYFETKSLKGLASWMKIQAQEELMHAMKFFDYVNEAGGDVKLTKIDGPDTEWKSPVHVFEATLKHEQYVTSRIHDLVDLAAKEKDHASGNFLKWFVDEQVEEEATASDILEQLKLVGDNGVALYMIDKELGARTPPAPTAGE